MEVKSRHHLREDEANEVIETINNQFDVSLSSKQLEYLETRNGPDLILVDGDPSILVLDEAYTLTVKGALELEPSRKIVTVDEGAVEFVTNGADVMRPGIVNADSDIESGDYVVVVEENHGKPIGIGRAMKDSDELIGDSGKVIESISYVGDELWEFEP